MGASSIGLSSSNPAQLDNELGLGYMKSILGSSLISLTLSEIRLGLGELSSNSPQLEPNLYIYQ